MAARAQSEKFVPAMKSALTTMREAKGNEELMAVAAKFDRIGQAEKNQWLPYYYAGIAKARLSMQKAGNPETLAEEAGAFAAKADSLQPNNSEVYCLKSMVATAKMLIDPMNRWMTFGKESSENLQRAKKADSTNPRPYVLEATAAKNTPEQFGGGCGKARPIAEKAAKLYATFVPASDIHPNWGKEMAEGLIGQCK